MIFVDEYHIKLKAEVFKVEYVCYIVWDKTYAVHELYVFNEVWYIGVIVSE